MSRTIVSIDVGGTHARFALAQVDHGRVAALGEAVTLKTSDYSSFLSAWGVFRGGMADDADGAAISIAGPVRGDLIEFTNNPWTIRPDSIADQLGVGDITLINDFGAVAHAVAQLGPRDFVHLAGPRRDLPETGRISIIGPGTGLGVAHLWRDHSGYQVQTTEGGHFDFAPVDGVDDAILDRLRKRHSRVSAERVVSGPALPDIYETLAAIEGRQVASQDQKALWTSGLDGCDPLAAMAIDRFCMALGSVAGDVALAQGGTAVVIAGGLGLRIEQALRTSGFAARFCAKGRFQAMMAEMPVKLITYPQPGLYGAAAAFAKEHG